MPAADWLQLLGYLLIVLAVGFGLYQLLPAPRAPRAEASPLEGGAPAARRSAAEWAHLADLAEGYAPGHGERVATLALLLAEACGLPEADHAPLHQAALLHDVGEVDFEPELLARKGPLTQSELFRLWGHAERGAALALEITGSPVVSQWVRWHHERWDGLGYPDGLSDVAIPLPARILRLADSAVAMLHDRPYRQALSPEACASELSRLAAVSYDPELTRILVDDVLPRFLAAGGLDAPENPWSRGEVSS